MKAMVLEKIQKPLVEREVPIPEISKTQVLIKVKSCGVCRTDLHIFDGDLPPPSLPLILGHQIVGTIEKKGEEVKNFQISERVGIPWLHKSCKECRYCKEGKENLCLRAQFTGYHLPGGFAEYVACEKEALLQLPPQYDALHVAPLLCAGLIGFRAYQKIQPAEKIGFYGFGSAAHILMQVALYQNKKIYAFTRKGDLQTQEFAKSLGAIWAGSSDEHPLTELDAAIIFAPNGELMVKALEVTKRGGQVISAGIHMSDIPSFPYSLLWYERTISSVANLTKKDGEDFMYLANKQKIQTNIKIFPLFEANEALATLKRGKVSGSIVLSIDLR